MAHSDEAAVAPNAPQGEGGPGSGIDFKKLQRAPRDRSIRDLVVFDKTRKMIVYWTPFVAITFGFGVSTATSVWQVLGAIVFGVMVYTLVEYLMHRFIYHWEPESKLLRILTADMGRSHMGHHREPHKYGGGINGNQRPIILFSSLIALGAWLTPFPTAFGLMATAAGAVNYVAQEFVHFGTHHLPMSNRFAAAMKRHHMIHHYRDDNTNFGLFWPFWDWILGTNFDARKTQKTPRGTPAQR
ncbi:MAG: sterol desaturase family protein [Pseudomonadota bacterium]